MNLENKLNTQEMSEKEKLYLIEEEMRECVETLNKERFWELFSLRLLIKEKILINTITK